MKISQRVSELQIQTKGHNSIKIIDEFMVLNHLCTSSGDAINLYQVSRKYLTGFQSY